MKRRFSIAFLLHDIYRVPLVLCMLVLLAGFGTLVTPVAAATPAFVRIIHASPDVGTADIFVDGTKLLSSFQFGAVTGYVAIPPGPHKVQIALVGKGIGGSVLSQTLSVTPGLAYTVAAIGSQQTGPSLEVFVDSNYVVPGSTKVRVYDLSPDAGTISVSAGSNSLVSSLAYKQAIILRSPLVRIPSKWLPATPTHIFHFHHRSRQTRCKAFSLSACSTVILRFNLYNHQQTLCPVCPEQEVHPIQYPTVQTVHGR
ncbi:MAG TPA: DUF4397 domain-containing protein [Ktedonobacteraceae bacterium]|nr:DUF4397 domain-containing protein [Ktedonobacteraceae bacterium]